MSKPKESIPLCWTCKFKPLTPPPPSGRQGTPWAEVAFWIPAQAGGCPQQWGCPQKYGCLLVIAEGSRARGQ